MRRTFVGLIVVQALVIATAASAQGGGEADRDRARTLFAEGVEASARTDWETAAARFEEALGHHTAPTIEYNLASTYHELGRLGEAGDLVAKVLADPEITDELRAHAEELDAHIADRAGTLTIELQGEANAGATVSVDGRALSPERIGVPRHETPGTREVTLTRADGSVETQRAVVGQAGVARATFGPPLLGDDAASEGLVTEPLFWAAVVGGALVLVAIIAVAAVASGPNEVGGDYDPGVLRF